VVPALFTEPDLRAAAEVLDSHRPDAGVPVDVTGLEVAPEMRSLLLAHAVDSSPEGADDLLDKARRMRLDAEIDRLEAVIAATDPAGEDYSQAFNRLIALQQEKRRR
jgi:hypothetical protein